MCDAVDSTNRTRSTECDAVGSDNSDITVSGLRASSDSTAGCDNDGSLSESGGNSSVSDVRSVDDIMDKVTQLPVPKVPTDETRKDLESKITKKIVDLTSVRQTKDAKKAKQKELEAIAVQKDKIRLMKTNQVVAMEAAIRKGVEDAVAYLRENEQHVVDAFRDMFASDFLMGNMSLNTTKVKDLKQTVKKASCVIVSSAVPRIGICGRYKLTEEDQSWFEAFMQATGLLEHHIRSSILELNHSLVHSASQGFNHSALRFDIVEGANPASWYALFVKLRVAKGVQQFFEEKGFYVSTHFDKDVLLLKVQWTNII